MPPSKTRRRKRARFGPRLRELVRPTPLWGVAGGVLALALIAELEAYVWLGAWAGELGLHLLLFALGVAVVCAVRRAWVALAATLAACLLLTAPLWPLLRGTRPTPAGGPSLRVWVGRLNEPSLSPAQLLSQLVPQRIELAALTAPSAEALAPLSTRLRGYTTVRSGEGTAPGLLLVKDGLLAKGAPVRTSPQAQAQLQLGRCRLGARVVNLPSLLSYGALDARAEAIAGLGKEKPLARSVWLGHFGSRAEAADLSAVLSTHGLRDGRAGHGRMATTPAALGMLGLPRDHVLVHGWLRTTAMDVKDAPAPGAHRALTATLELTESRCRAPQP